MHFILVDFSVTGKIENPRKKNSENCIKGKKLFLFVCLWLFFICLVLDVCCRHIRKHEANFHMFSDPTIIIETFHSIFPYIYSIQVDNFIV